MLSLLCTYVHINWLSMYVYVCRFDRVLSRFLSEIGQDSLVGVHCTHGLNRTGYLICRYVCT